MGRSLVLFVALFACWFVFSGFTEPFFLISGAVCCGLSLWIARRMGLVDGEGVPVQLGMRVPGYFLWLLTEIVQSGVQVCLRVWQPKLAISPTLAWVRTGQRSDLGKVVFGNSITLTPGTVCTELQGEWVQVHALEGAGIEDLGRMDLRVARLMGEG